MDIKLNYTPSTEEDGIDFVGLAKRLWTGRKTILICTAACFVIGLFAAFTMKRSYTVSTVLVPQMSVSRYNSLASLAGLSSFDMGGNTSSQDLSPLVFPHIVKSTPFCLELMHAPLHYAKADTAVSMLNYARDYDKPTAGAIVRKYTIGLPFTILGALKNATKKNEAPEDSLAAAEDTPLQPLVLTEEEIGMMGVIAASVSLSVDKKEGYLTLSVTGEEPRQTAELAVKAVQVLQSEITRFRTEKAQLQLDYIQGRYNEVKAETEACQMALATISDRSNSMTSKRGQLEQARLQARYNVTNSVFTEIAKQLEQAKMQVKRDTPVLAVLQPVSVPVKPSNSRLGKIIIWTFLGFVLGCGIIIGKNLLPKIKEAFRKSAP